MEKERRISVDIKRLDHYRTGMDQLDFDAAQVGYCRHVVVLTRLHTRTQSGARLCRAMKQHYRAAADASPWSGERKSVNGRLITQYASHWPFVCLPLYTLPPLPLLF